MIWLLAAMITGGILVYALAPLARAHRDTLAMCLLLVISAGALGLYLVYGNPDMPDQPMIARLALRQEALGQVAHGVDSLKAKLRENPNDVAGWLLLAQSEEALGNKQNTATALHYAIQLLPDAAPIKARLQAKLDALEKP